MAQAYTDEYLTLWAYATMGRKLGDRMKDRMLDRIYWLIHTKCCKHVMGVCDDGAESGEAVHGASAGALESEIIAWKNKAITRLTI